MAMQTKFWAGHNMETAFMSAPLGIDYYRATLFNFLRDHQYAGRTDILSIQIRPTPITLRDREYSPDLVVSLDHNNVHESVIVCLTMLDELRPSSFQWLENYIDSTNRRTSSVIVRFGKPKDKLLWFLLVQDEDPDW